MEIEFEPLQSDMLPVVHFLQVVPAQSGDSQDIIIFHETRIVDVTSLIPGETYTLFLERDNITGHAKVVTTSKIYEYSPFLFYKVCPNSDLMELSYL